MGDIFWIQIAGLMQLLIFMIPSVIFLQIPTKLANSAITSLELSDKIKTESGNNYICICSLWSQAFSIGLRNIWYLTTYKIRWYED